jgi:hypothetical protein
MVAFKTTATKGIEEGKIKASFTRRWPIMCGGKPSSS